MLKCPQNAKVAFAMLKNALMVNVKLMKRNSHQSLSSSNQILIGKLKQQVLLIQLPKQKKPKRKDMPTPPMLPQLKVILLFQRKQLQPL
jgi:hypothetical protein